MQIHGSAKLGPAGRLALTQKVIDGMTLRQAAGRFGVSVATAHRWWHRRLDASSDELASGVWLFDRSSRPREVVPFAVEVRGGGRGVMVTR
jgi:hypothetical protein